MKLTIEFDPVQQVCKPDFDQKEFKTFEMILAVLDMAKSDFLFRQEMARMQNMQQMQMQALQEQQIKNQLNSGSRKLIH